MDIIMLACPSEQKVHSLGGWVWYRHLLLPWHTKQEILVTADPECSKFIDTARKGFEQKRKEMGISIEKKKKKIQGHKTQK